MANIARHAPTNSTAITLDVVADEIQLVVVDRGRPAAPPIRMQDTLVWSACVNGPEPWVGSSTRDPTADGWIVEARIPVSPRVTEGILGA